MATNFRDRQYVLECLNEVLQEAHQIRHTRADYDPVEQRFQWNIYEQELMLSNVNMFRDLLGKKPVDRKAIIKADDTAAGHVDYAKKFALNCLDLVYGE